MGSADCAGPAPVLAFENDEGSSHHTQLVVPRSLRDQVRRDLHGGALSGHLIRPPENERLSHSEYAIQLRDKLESSYDAVRQHRQRVFQCQKDHYDKKVHGNPYTEGALVWLHSPMVSSGQSQKFHQPWTGPFRVVQQLSHLQDPGHYRSEEVTCCSL